MWSVHPNFYYTQIFMGNLKLITNYTIVEHLLNVSKHVDLYNIAFISLRVLCDLSESIELLRMFCIEILNYIYVDCKQEKS